MAELNLTPITKVDMMIDRLELGRNAHVDFIKSDGTGETTLLTLNQRNHWSLTGIANLYINVDFVRFLVLDFPGFEDIIAQTEVIRFEGRLYKLVRQYVPLGLNRVWQFKLEILTPFSS